MKRTAPIFVLLLATSSFFVACRPSHSALSGGGRGGSAIILVRPEFANFIIDTFKVYVKYATLDAPASGIYDDSSDNVVLINDTPTVVFAGLKTGIYYFYCTGYHTDPSHYPNLKGGLPVTQSVADTSRQYIPVYPYNTGP